MWSKERKKIARAEAQGKTLPTQTTKSSAIEAALRNTTDNQVIHTQITGVNTQAESTVVNTGSVKSEHLPPPPPLPSLAAAITKLPAAITKLPETKKETLQQTVLHPVASNGSVKTRVQPVSQSGVPLVENVVPPDVQPHVVVDYRLTKALTQSGGFMPSNTFTNSYAGNESSYKTVNSNAKTSTYESLSPPSSTKKLQTKRLSVKSDIQLNHYTSQPVQLRNTSIGNGTITNTGHWPT